MVKKRPSLQDSKINVLMGVFPWLSLVLVVTIFGITTKGRLFSAYNLKTIYSQTVVSIVGGLGLCFLFSQGAFDLSFGSTVGFSAILAALAYEATHITAMYIIVPMVVCTLIGVLNGVLYAYSGMVSFIQTMAISFILKGLFTTLMGKESGFNVPEAICNLDGMAWTLSILCVVTVIAVWLFNYTAFGKHCRMMGAGAVATVQSGVNVQRTKLLSFVVTGVTAGVVTIMSLARSGMASSSTGSMFEFNIMIALTLGGMPAEGGAGAKLRSVFIGSFIVSVLTNGMVLMGIPGRLQEVVKGLVFVLVLIFTMKLRERTKNIG